MDANECQTLIPAARDATGKTTAEICAAIDEAARQFRAAARAKFDRKREW